MFDNCKEISSLWHDSSSFNRLVAKVMNPRCVCRVQKSCGVCGERCPHFDTHTHTQTHTHTVYVVEAGPNRRAEPGSFLYWLDVLGFRERSPRCWWFNLLLCTQMSPSSANTSRHTHIHTRHLPRSHLHTITQQPLQSHTYSSALSKLLLSYLIIHMLNSHTDFGVVN